MQLDLKRTTFNPDCTLGVLSVDGVFECFTLEDPYRQLDNGTVDKWKGATAIPTGVYEVVIDFSQRFKREMPHVINVPQFEGIRIHPGNTAADTEGCILIGRTKGTESIGESRAAFDAFFPKLQAALAAGDTVHLTVA